MIDILDKAIEAAEKECRKYEASFNNLEPQHLNCGFAYVHIDSKRDPLVKAIKKALKERGVKFDSAGNMINLDGSYYNYSHNSFGGFGSMREFGRPDYIKGWIFSNPGNTSWQDMDCKLAGCHAFAAVLREHGVDCWTSSRLD